MHNDAAQMCDFIFIPPHHEAEIEIEMHEIKAFGQAVRFYTVLGSYLGNVHLCEGFNIFSLSQGFPERGLKHLTRIV